MKQINILKDKYICLYADCIPVKGAIRSIIYDINMQEYKFIPNSLYAIITKYQNKTIEEINYNFHNKYNDVIEEYVELLLSSRFVFFCDKIEEIKRFPKIDLNLRSYIKYEVIILDYLLFYPFFYYCM